MDPDLAEKAIVPLGSAGSALCSEMDASRYLALH